MRSDLEWLAHVMATKLCGDRARRFYVYRVAAFGDFAHYDERFEHLYKAGSL